MISPSIARPLLGIAGVLLYSLAMHYTSAVNPNRDWAAALVIAPFLGAALLIAWRSPQRVMQLTVCAAAISALVLLWPQLTSHVGWLYLLQHAGIYFLLGLMFGRTLVHQRTPLCTQFASYMTDHMTPRVCRYTRQVTVAWTLFFFGTASLSVLLFFFGSFEHWSIFANLLGLPLLGTMFAVEFAIRLRVLAPEERGSLRKTWQAWKNHGAVKPADTDGVAAPSAVVPPPSTRMSATLPLISHTDPLAPVAVGKHGMISAHQFLADVQGVAWQLPPSRHVLNVCTDRYHFAVGLAASIVSGKISLLPSTHTPETVKQLRAIAPDVFCLSDQTNESIDLPISRFPTGHHPVADLPFAPPLIDAEQVVAHVFTSGSTGLPVPHRKLWGKLSGNVSAAARSLGLVARPHHLVATVPPQHMYGLESSVLLAMLSGGSFWAGRPFYPADIIDAMAAVPEPRVLVTTPVHLRALCDASDDLPDRPGAALILCATAPLAIELARRGEQDFAAPLKEIYGCTETGQLATRQPTTSPDWQLFPEIRLEQDGETTYALGQWIEGRIALGDHLELLESLPPASPADSGRFILHGRHADLINLAGKRTSLAYLNHQLTAISGVSDGAFFVPDDHASTGVVRLVACVVAAGTDRRSIERELRQRIDPIFMPRPLFLVDALPRNATGKLPRPVFQQFIAGLSASTDKCQ